MDYMKNAKRKTIDGAELCFIRCDKNGNEIPEAALRGMNFTNATVERIVSEVASRVAGSAEGEGVAFDLNTGEF
ncbi:MAG: hypothetical protein RSD32_05615 [Oscillospiraceae bacterium]